ncbi:MAG: hypothetical protein GYA23_01870 [Methanomicrobiales archaeon]|nr:hypothetical protein [Methanomicrobiales archaeon]
MIGKRNRLYSEGVSEAIGFILIFSLVITGIGLVTLYGYPMLLKQQSSANERIMEKNMIVLQNDFKSLTYKTVPYKESSLKIEGGALYVHSTTDTPSVATIRIYDNNGIDYVANYHPGDLRYIPMDDMTNSISLQNGAVIKGQSSGSAMLAQPRWFYDSATNTWVINLMAVNSTKVQSKTGICLVKMGLSNMSEYIFTDTPAPPINFEYTPDPAHDYSAAWDGYFMNELKTAPPAIVGTTRTYTLPVAATPAPRLVIKKYEVDIQTL